MSIHIIVVDKFKNNQQVNILISVYQLITAIYSTILMQIQNNWNTTFPKTMHLEQAMTIRPGQIPTRNYSASQSFIRDN